MVRANDPSESNPSSSSRHPGNQREPGSAIGARVDLDGGTGDKPPRKPSGPGPTVAQREPGSFWRRLGAYLVDGVVLALATNLLTRLTLGPLPDVDPLEPAALDQLWPFYAVNAALAWLYFALLESSHWQATLGKGLLGLEVTDEDGGPISFLRASGRYFGKIASALPLGLGFLMIFATEHNQALHDKLAGCLVLREGTGRTPSREMRDPPREGW